MLIEAVRRFSRVAQGVTSDVRSGAYRELIVNDTGTGRYAENVMNGATFIASNSANQALSVGNSTATGLVLTNPAGSGKGLVLLEAIGALDIAATAMGGVALFANVNPVAAAVTHTTPLTVRPAALGSTATGAGLADSAATLPATPILVRPLLSVYWITANAAVANLAFKDDIGGALVVTPGCAVSIQAQTTAVTGIFSMTWAELDWPLA